MRGDPGEDDSPGPPPNILFLKPNFRADGAGRVFHHFEAVLGGQGQDAPQVAGHPQLVHRQDGPGAVRNGWFNQGRVKVAGLKLHVHEDGHGPYVAHRVGRGDKGVGDRDYFVAGLKIQGQQGQVQGRGAAGASHGVRRPHRRGEFFLKGRHLGTLNHPARQNGPPGRRGFLFP